MSSHPQLPPERSFGYLFVVACGAGAAYVHYAGLSFVLTGFLGGLAAALLIVSLLRPGLLAPLNRGWFALGLLLGRVMSPIVLGVIFFLVITPVALVTRLSGRDVLKLRRTGISTYWVARDPPGPEPESFRHQF